MKVNTKQHHTYHYNEEIIDDQEVGSNGERLITVVLSIPTLNEEFSIAYQHKPGGHFFTKSMLQARLKDVLTVDYKDAGLPIPMEIDRMDWIEKHEKTAYDVTVTLEVETEIAESLENDWEV